MNPDGSNAGTTYKFRHAAYNIHGWGSYSPEASILAADVPGVIQSTTIELTGGTSVKLSWQSPVINGSPVSAYKVEILRSTGVYAEETEYCSGSVDPSFVTTASCTIPMATFSDPSKPWTLPLGSTIQFRLTA